MSKLTDKEEKFAQLVVELGSQSEAYRRSYNAENHADKTVHEAASRLANKSKVSARIQEIRDELAIMAIWKKLDSVKGLSEVARGEIDEVRASDRVSAIKALNSMFGWDKTNVDISGTININKADDAEW